jgi:ATP-dependent DNA helicase
MYHGSPAERAELRRTDMDTSLLLEDYHEDVRRRKKDNLSDGPSSRGRGRRGGRKSKGKGGKKGSLPRKTAKGTGDNGDESVDKTPADSGPEPEEVTHQRALKNKFPVVVTTYELIMKDRAYLTHYQWGFIVVDEGHRLKNMDCKLMREIKHYESAGRMVLTGTPLQVCSCFCNFLSRTNRPCFTE